MLMRVIGGLVLAAGLGWGLESTALAQAPRDKGGSAVTCPEGEGKAVTWLQGLTFCGEPARIENAATSGMQEGVRVSTVDPKSLAALAGFQPGDIVYRIGGQPVNTGATAVKLLESLRPNQEAVVNFWRNGLPYLIRIRG